MFAKWFAAGTLVLWAFVARPVAAQYQADPPSDGAPAAPGQSFATPASGGSSPAWRPPAQMPHDAAGNSEPIRPLTPLGHGPIAHVSKGPGTLPNDAGQE